jgi:hypothetical protein
MTSNSEFSMTILPDPSQTEMMQSPLVSSTIAQNTSTQCARPVRIIRSYPRLPQTIAFDTLTILQRLARHQHPWRLHLHHPHPITTRKGCTFRIRQDILVILDGHHQPVLSAYQPLTISILLNQVEITIRRVPKLARIRHHHQAKQHANGRQCVTTTSFQTAHG